MSLIIARNFKRAKAQDAAAQDIKLPFIITFNNGKKEFREGYSEEEVRRRFDKSVAALYGGIKSVKLEGEDKRDGKDSIAAKEREYTRLYELAQKNITFYTTKGDSAKVVEWKRKADEYKRLAQEAENAAEARNGKDSHAEDADKVIKEKSGLKLVQNLADGTYWVYLPNGGGIGYGTNLKEATQKFDLEARFRNSHATDYDPNPQTRGKDIEVFSAQAIREESACENVLRKVIEDVDALIIKIHGPMSSWEEVIENSQMSPELPQAKKWSATANRRYDYLLARERALRSILSELKKNHID